MLNRLPPMPPTQAPWAGQDGDEDEEEIMEELDDEVTSLNGLERLNSQTATAQVPCPMSKLIVTITDKIFNLFVLANSPAEAVKSSMFRSDDLAPISASGFFSQALEIDPEASPCVFRAFYTPSTLSKTTSSSPSSRQAPGRKPSVLVCHHGAGSSGTTFAMLAKQVQEKSGGELGVLAFDCRGHGESIRWFESMFSVLTHWPMLVSKVGRRLMTRAKS